MENQHVYIKGKSSYIIINGPFSIAMLNSQTAIFWVTFKSVGRWRHGGWSQCGFWPLKKHQKMACESPNVLGPSHKVLFMGPSSYWNSIPISYYLCWTRDFHPLSFLFMSIKPSKCLHFPTGDPWSPQAVASGGIPGGIMTSEKDVTRHLPIIPGSSYSSVHDETGSFIYV